jgi:hypothetical protein
MVNRELSSIINDDSFNFFNQNSFHNTQGDLMVGERGTEITYKASGLNRYASKPNLDKSYDSLGSGGMKSQERLATEGGGTT